MQSQVYYGTKISQPAIDNTSSANLLRVLQVVLGLHRVLRGEQPRDGAVDQTGESISVIQPRYDRLHDQSSMVGVHTIAAQGEHRMFFSNLQMNSQQASAVNQDFKAKSNLGRAPCRGIWSLPCVHSSDPHNLRHISAGRTWYSGLDNIASIFDSDGMAPAWQPGTSKTLGRKGGQDVMSSMSSASAEYSVLGRITMTGRQGSLT